MREIPVRQCQGVRLAGTGMAVPPKILTNADLENIVDTTDEWITQRTGIKTRHVLEPGQRNSDLGTEAVLHACRNAGVEPGELDMLICATMTPDVICPAMSATIVKKIGAIPAGAMDLNIACTGFVAALSLASSSIQAGHYKKIAVVASEALTSITNYEDRSTCVLFGDGASAAILVADDDPTRGCLYQSLGSDGERGEVLYVPRDEKDIPDGEEENFTGAYNKLQMNGRAVYKFAVEKLADCVDAAMQSVDASADEIAMVIPHQSNIRMLKSAWKRLGFDTSKIHINIDRFGNTSAASAGICLHECVDQGKIKDGDLIVFVAQGGGLSWGSILWKV